MGEYLLSGKTSSYVTIHLVQLGLPSLRDGKLSTGLSSWG